jgi:hypothetical protein
VYPIRQAVARRAHYGWTVGGAIAVSNNLINWHHPERQTTYLARRHKGITILVLAAYAYHFLLEDLYEAAHAGH